MLRFFVLFFFLLFQGSLPLPFSTFYRSISLPRELKLTIWCVFSHIFLLDHIILWIWWWQGWKKRRHKNELDLVDTIGKQLHFFSHYYFKQSEMSFVLPLATPKANPIDFWSLYGKVMEETQSQLEQTSVCFMVFISSVTSRFEQHLSFLLSLVLSYMSSLNGNFGCPKVVVNFRPSMKFKLLDKEKLLHFISPQSSFLAQAEMILMRAHASSLSPALCSFLSMLTILSWWPLRPASHGGDEVGTKSSLKTTQFP